MLKLDLANSAFDSVLKLEAKQFRQIGHKIMALMKDPRPNDSSQLRGYPKYFRVDVGEFRIVYSFDKDCLYILLIEKRNDDEIYKRLKNIF
jgi:mRNA interferase RelE/StbE